MLELEASVLYNATWDEGNLVGERVWMGNCGTVLVVDRDPAFCGVVAVVARRLGLTPICGESADEGLELVGDMRPALAIVEVELPGSNGLAVLHDLHVQFDDDLPVILVSTERTDSFDRTAGLLVGADDYLVKPLDSGELAARMRRSLRRAGFVSNGDSPTRGVVQPTLLSPRESEILRLLASGRSQREIATTLVISSKTVATHIQHVLSKLGVHSRAEAVAAAYRRGLVVDDVVAHAFDAALIGAD
jgi:DNA-binding NarL/FixJ family response regulator